VLIGGKSIGCKMSPTAEKVRKSLVSEEESTDEAIAGTEPLAESSRDGRRSRRFRVPQECQPCELKAGGKVLPAALVNESKTGLAVLVDRLDGLETGKEVELHSDIGWFTVQIVYIKKVAPCAYSATKCDTLFQLGMKKTASSFRS
jgi:hypothetical protein